MLPLANATSLGPILAVVAVVAIARRRHEIGGWLLVFHVFQYVFLVLTISSAAVGLENFVPSTEDGDMTRYGSFLIHTIPMVIVQGILLTVSEAMRIKRSAALLRVVRRLMIAQAALAWTLMMIDGIWFYEPGTAFPSGTSAYTSAWALYIHFAKRVGLVYVDRAWPRP